MFHGLPYLNRDINEHDFNYLFWMPTIARLKGQDPPISAKEIVEIVADKMKPLEPDTRMPDYSTDFKVNTRIVLHAGRQGREMGLY